jgi:hypothetical protein
MLFQVNPCAVVCGEAAVAVGDGELRCCATTGETLGVAVGLGLGFAEGVGEGFGDGVARGVSVGRADADRSLEFRLVGRSAEPTLFEFVLPRRCESEGGGAGPASLRATSRPVDVELPERAPGMVKTTSSLLPRCSTRAVAPGCRRKETTVSFAPRCTLTSPNARPRTASGRGTSAAGILT